MTEERKKKLSVANMGKHNSPSTEFKKGNPGTVYKHKPNQGFCKGHRHSEKVKDKIRKAMNGNTWNKR